TLAGLLKVVVDGQTPKIFFQKNATLLITPVVIIDTNNIDFVKSKEDYYKLCETIFQNSYNTGISRVIL
nr:hypothetical protein [Prolixibacteraceae bacterium]